MALVGPGFAFFHIPRTGGTWLRHALRIAYNEDRDQKLLVEEGDSHCAPFTSPGKLRFTIVRDWIPWKISFENLLRFQQVQSDSDKSWNEWDLFQYLTKLPGEAGGSLSAERCFFPFIDGVDLLLHTETLKEDTRKLLSRLNKDPNVVDRVPNQSKNSSEKQFLPSFEKEKDLVPK